VRTTEAIRTEKRKLRLLLHKLKLELGHLYHNHFMEFALLPKPKNDYGKKRYNYSLKKKDTAILTIQFVYHNQ